MRRFGGDRRADRRGRDADAQHVGLLLAIDPILDMGRIAVNVAGQALVPLIVAKRHGLIEPEGKLIAA